EAVLERATVEEMWTLQTISDHVRWTSGYGLGLQLLRDGERILAGHGGSMPGFIASLFFAPADRVGVALLTNSTTARLREVALRLVAETAERWPVPADPWRVDGPAPDDVVPLLGTWFME